MLVCDYGCGREATHRLKCGKWCCESNHAKCPNIREKNSKRNKFRYIEGRINSSKSKISCRYCGREIGITNISRHEESCYLNPLNMRLCPVCHTVIEKGGETCSQKCRIQHFGPPNPGPSDEEASARTLCFRYHKKECVVCGEKLMVCVHHLDENHSNNNPENLIPLCPTHHLYIHSNHRDVIMEKVLKYVTEKYDQTQ